MRRSPFFPILLGALALVASGAPRLAADEPPAPAAPAPSPAERAEKVLAALPGPKAGDSWSFEGDVLINGALMGSATLRLEAVKEGEADLWKATETVRIGPAEKPVMSIDLEAVIDATLTGLHGTTVSTDATATTTVTWRRTPLGYGLERTVGQEPAEKALLKDVTALKASLCGLVRFCRALPAEPAVYAVQSLNQEANVGPLPERRVKDVVLTVEGEQEVTLGARKGRAWVVRLKDDDAERTLAFDPKDRALLALSRPSSRLEILKKGLAGAAKEQAAFDWKGPATSPEGAAIIAGRAFAVADVEAIERNTWWPAATEKAKDQPGLAELDEAGRKAKILESLKANLKAGAPAAMIEPVLEQIRGDLVVEDAGEGRKRVKFPEMFRSLELVVMEVEGAWYLAEFPTKPSAPPK